MKCSSGTRFRRSRAPICLRRNGVARSSARVDSFCFFSSPSAVKNTRAVWRSGVTWTRVIVTNPIPGSCTSRASNCPSSPRIWSATRSGREPCDNLRRYGDAFLDERLDDVADLDVVVLLEADAALEPGLDLADVVLEATQRADLAFVDDDVVAQEASLRVARPRHAALGDHTARNRPVLRYLEDLAHR